MAVAKRCGADILDGKVGWGRPPAVLARQPPGLWPLRNVLGMSRIRVAYTAGAAIGPDLFKFLPLDRHRLKQFYGQTETCAYVCLQPDGQIKFDTVGPAGAGRRDQDRRQRRCWSRGRCCSRNTTSARMPRPNRSTPTAGS